MSRSVITPAPAALAPIDGRWLSARSKMFIALLAGHAVVDCLGGVFFVFKKLAHLDLFLSGIIATMTLCLGSALQPLFGYIADGGRRRMLLVMGVALASLLPLVGPAAFLLPEHDVIFYSLMFVILLLCRVGQGMFHPAGASLAGSMIQARRSTGLAVFISVGFLAYASSQALFSTNYLFVAGHTELLTIGGLLVAAWVWWWCRPQELPRAARPNFWQDTRTLIGSGRPVIMLFLTMTLISAAQLGLLFLMPEFLDQRGYPEWFVNGGGFGCFIAGSALLMPFAGNFADRFGRQRVFIICIGTAMLCYAIMTLTVMPLWVFAVVCFITGGFQGAANPLGVSLAQQMTPQQASMISGVMMGLAWACSSLIQSVVGFLGNLVGPVQALQIHIFTYLAALLCALMIGRKHAGET